MHDMELPENVLAVARAGAGVNNIPLEKYASQGVVVFNTPGANANGVKELVLAGMFLAARDVIGGIEWVKETAGKVISVLEQDSTEMSMKWNKRYRDNVEKLKTGDAFEVADIVRNLSFKQKEKGLSTTEKKMLNNAKQILVSELVLSEEKEQKEIEELVENKINASYELHIAASEELPKVVGIPDDVANSKVVKKFIPTNNNTANNNDY